MTRSHKDTPTRDVHADSDEGLEDNPGVAGTPVGGADSERPGENPPVDEPEHLDDNPGVAGRPNNEVNRE